ncbi:MAG: hypothetical protein Q7U42_14620, partial [Parvibaculum sp.]|nr:hypothetical protein [Parvibaculum sp.]
LMGLLAGWLAFRGGIHSESIRLFAAVGVLGGFTTFSAFSMEAALMIERRQLAMAGGYVAGSLTGGRLVRRIGIDGTLRFGGFCAALGGLLMLSGLLMTPSAMAIVLPVVIYGFSMGATMPQAMAGALTPFPDIAGTASSLLGFLQSFAGALAGLYVGHGVEASALPMVGIIAAGGVLSFVIAMSGRRKTA